MLRVGFVTCVELGLGCMHAIYSAGGQLHLAITLHDSKVKEKSGRVFLDAFCRERNVPLVKIDHVDDAVVQEAITAHKIDWLFIVGWSQIAGAGTLSAPSRGCIGIHPTLLPIGRGRAPIPWTIIKGLHETGITMFVLDEGVDSGPIIAQETVSVEATETATSLYKKIAHLHKDVIENTWNDLISDNVDRIVQDDDRATYWPARRPEDGEILECMTTLQVDRLVRGVTRPYPGAFYRMEHKTLRVWAGKCVTDCDAGTASTPLIALSDGLYRPEDWEWETC